MTRTQLVCGALLTILVAACSGDEKSDESGTMVVTGSVTSKLTVDNARAIAVRDDGVRIWTYLDVDRDFTLRLPVGHSYRVLIANQRADGTQETIGRLTVGSGATKSEWIGANEPIAVDLGRLRVASATVAGGSTLGTLSRGGYEGSCGSCAGSSGGSSGSGYGGDDDDDDDDDKHDDDKDCHEDKSETSSSSSNSGSGRGGYGGDHDDDDDDDDNKSGVKKCNVCAGGAEKELEPSKPVSGACEDKAKKPKKPRGGYGDQAPCGKAGAGATGGQGANGGAPAGGGGAAGGTAAGAGTQPQGGAGASCLQGAQCSSNSCVAATCTPPVIK